MWLAERVTLEVRADYMAALTLILRLKGLRAAVDVIARELALNLGDAARGVGLSVM